MICKLGIVLDIKRYLGCSELGKTSLGAWSWRDMKVIGIHHTMWGGDYDRIGMDLFDFFCYLFVCCYGGLYFLFLSFPYLWNDQRRMRHHIGCYNVHWVIFFLSGIIGYSMSRSGWGDSLRLFVFLSPSAHTIFSPTSLLSFQ